MSFGLEEVSMKRTSKSVFFIVLVLILALTYTSFFGVYSQFGDRTDTVIRGAKDIRWGIDIRGGVDVTYGPVDETVTVTEANLQAVQTIIADRLVGKGITDYEMYADTANKQVIVRFPWASNETDFDPSAAIQELGQTALLEFRIGDTYETDKDGKVTPTGKLVLTGKEVKEAIAGYQKTSETATSEEPVVQLVLDETGKQAFSDATKQQANKGTISIWLDGVMISNPSVKEQISTGEAVISGNFQSVSEASELANLINSGSLPFAIEAKSSGTVSPTMGEKALDAMVLAGIIAFVLIAVFMIWYYRLPGVVAVVALLGQIAGSIATVSGYFGVFDSFTLTLPGIAGIILSIGMGVDANVITSERIKEEIRLGKPIDTAIRLGSKNSFWAIFDGNITVVIVAVILMGVFGPADGLWSMILSPILRWFPASTTGSVYSFGYTLLIGTVYNFVMGVWASRAMLRSVSRFGFLRKPWLYGGDKA
jgi:protein-export membrane protein SecD